MKKTIFSVSRVPHIVIEPVPITSKNPTGEKQTVIHIDEYFYKNGKSITKEKYNKKLTEHIKKIKGRVRR